MNDQNYLQLCNTLLAEMNWQWDHPRVVDWLARVGKATTGRPYTLKSPIPESVYVSLAKFLDLYNKCDRDLQVLQWSWSNPKVREIQAKYRCVGQLPLKGYIELHDLLNDEWFTHGIPF